ncbi:2OG-Fe(II) oxygenase [Sphingomonas sp. R647]|uniref:2OG-Fe(II) oxygenase n=1 Tax=Sphingomonas sp. R647 TaxID=2875233 RepID=UPI001CD66707|nr:2OG-Fe(II) oxygenase [Sphingomonas sp. R647]MCA1196537.1 2OG-Fe(II) oxygenase [Sphingomonas sp. R647]
MTAPTLPHLRIVDFLDVLTHAALLDWALANEARFTPARLNGGTVNPELRRALTLRDLGPLAAALDARLREQAPRWIAALRSTAFAISEVELELAAHNDGAHFTLHTDTYASSEIARGDRMLSAVYYFHRQPKGFEGGALRLHRLGAAPGDAGLDLAPDDNSLVVFPSWGPHEVMPVKCASGAFADSRFAVNCWIYRARS